MKYGAFERQQAVPLLVSSVLGITVLGSISLCGVLAVELAPPGLSGTAHALSALAANSKSTFFFVWISLNCV
ncbi:unnamed protein product [Trichobilharzia regenti]|nr:unnamed protein product [Trichobilharzia regenti]